MLGARQVPELCDGSQFTDLPNSRYNIEPFFFSSSLKWIPSRFQEDLQPQKQYRKACVSIGKYVLIVASDITVTLTFLRCLHKPDAVMRATRGIMTPQAALA